MGLSMPEVALIAGYKDPRMLFRYTHLDPERVLSRTVMPRAALYTLPRYQSQVFV